MRIKFERTGGFANIPLRYEVDTEQMPPAKAQELHRLVEEARAFDQPAKPAAPANMPDQFQYELTFEDDARSHTFQTSDLAASHHLQGLLDWLSDEAFAELKKKMKKP
jgi:hypothetical protein